jgi:hypothetical protein
MLATYGGAAAGLQPVKMIANRPAYGRLYSLQYAGDLRLVNHGEIEQNWRILQYFDLCHNTAKARPSWYFRLNLSLCYQN